MGPRPSPPLKITLAPPHSDDPNGVEELSRRLPARRAVAQRRREPERATPGIRPVTPTITFARKRGEPSEYLGIPNL